MIGTFFFQGVEPDHLQVQIIVWQHLAGLCDETVDVQHFPGALIGRAHGPADILTDPAGIDLVFVGFNIQFHEDLLLFRDHREFDAGGMFRSEPYRLIGGPGLFDHGPDAGIVGMDGVLWEIG